MTDDLTRLREWLATTVPRDVDLVPQVEAFMAGVDAVIAVLERVPGHRPNFTGPVLVVTDPSGDWTCNAHSDGMSCCADAPNVYRIAEHEETA